MCFTDTDPSRLLVLPHNVDQLTQQKQQNKERKIKYHTFKLEDKKGEIGKLRTKFHLPILFCSFDC